MIVITTNKIILTYSVIVISALTTSYFILSEYQYIYFALEAKKYLVILFFLICMSIFSIRYRLSGTIVFFSLLSSAVYFPILTFFYPVKYSFLSTSDASNIQIPEAVLILSGLYLFFLGSPQTNHGKSTKTNQFLILYIYYIFSLALISHHFFISFFSVFTFCKIYIFFFIFRRILRFDVEYCVNALVLSIIALILVEFLVAILQQAGIDTFMRFTDTEFQFTTGTANRVSGTVGRPNLHKLFTITLPFLLSYSFYYAERYKKILIFMALTVGLIVVALTRNRTPMIALLIGCMYVLYNYHTLNRFRIGAKHVLAILTVIFLSYKFFFLGASDISSIVLRGTGESRVVQATHVFKRFSDEYQNLIFGFGPGSYKIRYNAINLENINAYVDVKNIYTMHNQYLLILYENGLIGLFLFLFWFYIIFKSLKVNNKDDGLFVVAAKIGIAGSFVGFLLSGLTRPLFGNISLPFIAIYLTLLYFIETKEGS